MTAQHTPLSSEQSDDDEVVVLEHNDIVNEEGVLPLSSESQEDIKRWLKPTPYDAENGEYRKHLASHLPGTGEWLLSSATFYEWHNAKDQGVLWIKGIPGSGKSVMTAHLVDTLSKETAPVLYFFFRQIIDANHKPDALLRDWLAQLLSYSPPLQAKLNELVENHKLLEHVSMQDMWNELKSAMTHMPKVYCVVDALDEMDQGNDIFLQSLVQLGHWHPSQVKVIITSRPVVSVERPLRRESLLQIRLEEKLVDIDVVSYVSHRLQHAVLELSPEHCNLIREAVPGRANGLFLYAKLSMDAFLEENADAHQVLEALPTDLNVMYSGLLREHAKRSGVSHDLQLLILSLVTHASRPLRLLEIAEVIKVVENRYINKTDDLKAIKDLVRATCGPLLEVLPDETVCVVHHSFTEFLNGSTRLGPSACQVEYPILDPHTTHSKLALTCLSYLLSGCLDRVKLTSDDDYETDSEDGTRFYKAPVINRDLPMLHPFFQYSLDNWFIHTRKADCTGKLSTETMSKLDETLSSRNLEAITTLTRWRGQSLHIAANLGLTQYVTKLIQMDGVDVNVVDVCGWSPIFHAASSGHTSVVDFLLHAGAKPDEPDTKDGRKPLHFAAFNTHGGVIKLLLEAGVSPLTEKTLPDTGMMEGDPHRSVGHTPLMYAVQRGHEAAAKAFLPYLKDAETVSRALAWAVVAHEWRRTSQCKIVEAILQHSLSNVNAKVRGETPLYLAAKNENLEIIMVLLKAGADPNILSVPQGDEYGGSSFRRQSARYVASGPRNQTPLHALCNTHLNRRMNLSEAQISEYFKLLQECMELLLESCLDIDQIDSKGRTALCYASTSEPIKVRLLLKSGANVNIARPDGSTLLHGCHNPEIIRMLVQEGGGDVNRRQLSDGKTPFLSLSHRLRPALVHLFVDLGADLTLTDHFGRGALHDAALDIKTLDTILRTGFPPDARDDFGESPLHFLGRSVHAHSLLLPLIAAGADINGLDKQGRSPLFGFVRNSRLDFSSQETLSVLDELITQGARLDILDHRGRNLLFACAETCNTSMMAELIKRGLDVKSRDSYGNTLLHEMAIHADDEHLADWRTVEEVCDLGVDPDQTNYDGQLALHFMLVPRSGDEPEIPDSCRDIDVADRDGIRPLHIAVKSWENAVESLLARGASPINPSLEGMTPLHVAIRFRQPNIVGTLLEAIEAAEGKTGLIAHLNTQHRPHSPLALHLACRSGVPEVVRLLLAAGADPNKCNGRIPSPLRWCVSFEQEESLWVTRKSVLEDAANKKRSGYEDRIHVQRDLVDRLMKLGPTGGIMIADSTRDFSSDYKQPATRLEEILDLLHAHGADMIDTEDEQGRSKLDLGIAECRIYDDYTVECLARFRQKLYRNKSSAASNPKDSNATDTQASRGGYNFLRQLPTEMLPFDSFPHTVFASLCRRSASREAFLEAEARTDFKENEDLLELMRNKIAWANDERLLRSWRNTEAESWIHFKDDNLLVAHLERVLDFSLPQRDWDIIRYILQQVPGLFSLRNGSKILCKLAENGYVALLRDIIAHQRSREMPTDEDKAKCMAETTITAVPKEWKLSMIKQVCSQSFGNMPMLRYLIEEMKSDSEADDRAARDAALLGLCNPRHWWQAAEGLPYIIGQGANLEIRGRFGRCPLHIALSSTLDYSNRAIEALIKAGADVTSVSSDGATCLDLAAYSLEAMKMLIENGAQGGLKALASAIQETDVEIVETLLEAGIDPNSFQPKEQTFRSSYGEWFHADRTSIPPLIAASLHHAFSSIREATQQEEEDVSRIIQLLLKHHADPYATFIKQSDPHAKNRGENVIILHQIIDQGGIIQPFLQIPNLDLERQDPQGRTLLLSACGSEQDPDIPISKVKYDPSRQNVSKFDVKPQKEKSEEPTTIQFLLDRGADINARDCKKKNALHLLLEVPSFAGYDSLRLLLSRKPELLHETDDIGETPLHYALRRIPLGPLAHLDTKAVEILLDAGADILQPDAQGNTALHLLARWLAYKGMIEGDVDKPRTLFKHFVSLGLPINGRNNNDETPAFSFILHESKRIIADSQPEVEEERQTQALEVLAETGADFFVVNREGETLMHALAAADRSTWRSACMEMNALLPRFRWLLDIGLDPLAEDVRGRTCLDIATAKGHDGILKMFKPAK